MKLYTDSCGSAVYCGERYVVLCESPIAHKRVRDWYPDRSVPDDATKIVAAGDNYRQVATRLGWKLRNQADIDRAAEHANESD